MHGSLSDKMAMAITVSCLPPKFVLKEQIYKERVQPEYLTLRDSTTLPVQRKSTARIFDPQRLKHPASTEKIIKLGVEAYLSSNTND